MSDIVTEVVNEARYAERIRAFFALSGCTLLQPINDTFGDGVFYQLPGELYLNGDPNHASERLPRRGFVTQIGAMKAALYAMGVDIASDRFTRETGPITVVPNDR